MPFPEGHLQRLEEDLAAQERWLYTLRRHIAGLQDRVSAHEKIIALGRDQILLRAVEDLYEQRELFEHASDDPQAFFEERRVRVLDDAAVTVNREPQRFAVEARFETTTLKYGVGWSPHAGFYAIEDEAPNADTAGEEERP